MEITKPMYLRWKQQYGGTQAEEGKRLTHRDDSKFQHVLDFG